MEKSMHEMEEVKAEIKELLERREGPPKSVMEISEAAGAVPDYYMTQAQTDQSLQQMPGAIFQKQHLDATKPGVGCCGVPVPIVHPDSNFAMSWMLAGVF